MKIIVFTHNIGGHHLEYIHHVYDMALKDKNNQYIFVLPRRFNEIKDNLKWESSDNIVFELFDYKYGASTVTLLTLIKDSYSISRLLRLFSLKYRADFIYCNEIIVTFPFAPLIIPRKTKLIGIIYKLYLYQDSPEPFLKKAIERMKFWLMSNSGVYKRLLVLNDVSGAKRLNELWHTKKFVQIPDPFVNISLEGTFNLRNKFGINEDNVLFVHFGAMNDNKGTLEIAHSLLELSTDEKRKYSFFFAGKMADYIKSEFYGIIEKLKQEGILDINVVDEYCSYVFFASLCMACNAILTPYRRTAQSSGLIGYASQFGKPVIAPSKGLLGNLVEKYELGLLISDCSPNSLVDAYSKIAQGAVRNPGREYCNDNSVENFQKVLKQSLKGI